MTTTIKVTSHNYPALVRIIDRYATQSNGRAQKVESISEQVVRPEDGELQFHCTTSRMIEIIDVDYNDPRVLALTPLADAPA